MSLSSPTALAGDAGGSLFGGGGTTPTEPTITVTGRADGVVYPISAGARSLTISNPGGATLLTTVHDGAAGVVVTGATTTTPSWTAAAGGSTGKAYAVFVTGTDPATGLVSVESFTEFVAGTGGGGTSWTEALADDWTGEGAQDLTSGGDGAKTLGGSSWQATGTSNADTWGPDGSTGIRFDSNAGGAIRLAIQADNLTDVEPDSLLWMWASASVIPTGMSTSGSYFGVQFSNVNNGPGTQGGQAIFRYNAASDWRWRVTLRSGGSWGTNVNSGAAVVTSEPTSMRVAVLIDQGQALVFGDVNGGTGKPGPGDLAYLGYVDFGVGGSALTTARRFGMYLHLLAGASTDVTVVNSGVQRIEG